MHIIHATPDSYLKKTCSVLKVFQENISAAFGKSANQGKSGDMCSRNIIPKRSTYLGASKNRGTPKWMVYIGTPY